MGYYDEACGARSVRPRAARKLRNCNHCFALGKRIGYVNVHSLTRQATSPPCLVPPGNSLMKR
jgi:hypothetical protein